MPTLDERVAELEQRQDKLHDILKSIVASIGTIKEMLEIDGKLIGSLTLPKE